MYQERHMNLPTLLQTLFSMCSLFDQYLPLLVFFMYLRSKCMTLFSQLKQTTTPTYVMIQKPLFFFLSQLFFLLVGISVYLVIEHYYVSSSSVAATTTIHVMMEENNTNNNDPSSSPPTSLPILLHPNTVEYVSSTPVGSEEVNEDENCPICYEHPREMKLSCGHSFCQSCLQQSLLTYKFTCPYCRQSIHVQTQQVVTVTELKPTSSTTPPLSLT